MRNASQRPSLSIRFQLRAIYNMKGRSFALSAPWPFFEYGWDCWNSRFSVSLVEESSAIGARCLVRQRSGDNNICCRQYLKVDRAWFVKTLNAIGD